MTKHEHPPFRMVIEGGKMVPATAYDAERLDTYRRGTEVRVTLTEEKDRPMVRKWWAILGRAIKECKTPWQNKEQASEAIKLALGIVNLSKTVGGAWLQYPKSLTELTDPEVTEAVERMIDVIYHVTGVDASVWRKHVENIRDENPSENPPSSDGGSDGATEPPSTPAVAASPIEPASGGPAPADETEAQEEPGASSAGDFNTRNLKIECLDKFMALATADGLDVKQRRDNIELVKDLWKQALPTDLEFVKACLTTADKVAKGELAAGAAKKYLGGLL